MLLPSPSTDRRSRRSVETRERLFRAALEVFSKKGFVETTVEDITNAADVGKGTFFNYFPSKDHILLAFAEMQLSRLRHAVDEARENIIPLRQFFRSLTSLMTVEPTRHPDVIRVILLAFLSNPAVRQAMLDLQDRVLAIHSEMIQLGQERGEVRNDLPATAIALVFRQTIFGTLLIWSLYGDDSLPSRMESAFEVIWSGLAPRNNFESHVVTNMTAPTVPLFF